MATLNSLFRHGDALVPTTLATGYALIGWSAGLATLMLSSHWLALLAGTLLLAHAMVIAAYMLHECAHNAVFRRPEHNARLGRALNWLTGGCYGTYEDVRHKHMRHHVDNADVVAYDYRGFLRRHGWLRRTVQALEWAYVPAVELLMHGMQMIAPFVDPMRADQRRRATTVLVVRGGLFLALVLLAPMAAVLYVLAYLLFLTVLRFMDAFQHNYELLIGLQSAASAPRKGDRAYEQSHTFSNPISLQHPWLNLLTLNFAYHNAHHERPTLPWYRLPELHAQMYPDADTAAVIPFHQQLLAYHRNRVPRVLEVDTGEDYRTRMEGGQGVGAAGVSFLTAF